MAKNKRELKKRKDFHNKKLYINSLLSRIKKFDEPILSEVCEPVRGSSLGGDDISELYKLIRKVLAVTKNGVGLAAPQIGFKKRILAIRPKIDSHDISIFINPVIVEQTDDEKHTHIESCLSYPGHKFPIERFHKITVEYYAIEPIDNIDKVSGDKVLIDQDKKWGVLRKKTDEFKHFEAIILQHEIDHLDGGGVFLEKYNAHKEFLKNNPDFVVNPKKTCSCPIHH